MLETSQPPRPLRGFCCRCKRQIPLNKEFPLCQMCGGACSAMNRFSSTEGGEIYCHGCGEAVYVSLEHPFCNECEKSK